MTVDDLRERLKGLKGHWQITFGELAFGRIKQRGKELVDIELHPLVYWDSQAQRWIVMPDDPPESSKD